MGKWRCAGVGATAGVDESGGIVYNTRVLWPYGAA